MTRACEKCGNPIADGDLAEVLWKSPQRWHLHSFCTRCHAIIYADFIYRYNLKRSRSNINLETFENEQKSRRMSNHKFNG